MMTSRGPGLYEFLTEAELQQYFNAFKKDLKVHNVGQLKFVTEEDLTSLGMSKPEIRRLKKYFQKYCPQNYLSKFKKILLPKKDGTDNVGVIIPDESGDRTGVRVPSKHIIPADAIVINKELGVGEFGVVQQGVWTNEEGERIQVAIKCLSKERMQSQPMEFLKEAAIMHTIDSEHIVRLYGVVLDTNALMLVTELAPLRSLLECLKEPSLRVSFPVTTLCDFCVQICDGMCYLESKRLIHRDLAARNILVFSKNKIKISDFGLSRALGVGKDYYQTNFNVNLKLPIAWCAPECINFLRFTSASDVWAFGVTLWELFSYGFQPWAALTGQQILEAIDEPNFQENYFLEASDWSNPRYAQRNIIVSCLGVGNTIQLKGLNLRISSMFYLIPLSDNPSVWKGVLKNGKTGLFNPANTVAYLGTSVPSNKSTFQRGDGKNAYSSRRRLRPEMISGPQGDFKHTGHVGLDGAYFGDVSFLGEKVQSKFLPKGTEKYNQLPKQIVTPYKPSEDEQSCSTLTRASSDVSDKAPLLKKVGEKGKFGPASDHHWSDTGSEDHSESLLWPSNKSSNPSAWSTLKSEKSNQTPKSDKGNNDHEYHEISDEEDHNDGFSKEKKEGSAFRRDSFDLGPSLMDEVFRALGGSSTSTGVPSSTFGDPPGSLPPLLPSQSSASCLSVSAPLASFPSINSDDDSNIKNEIKEIVSSKFGSKKKKQATVKPISPNDERTLDSAIAMANDLASKSLPRLDGSLEAIHNGDDSRNGTDLHHNGSDSPATPTSPTKSSKFSFKFSSRGSPKPERRHFSEEAASIADIQSSITEEAKEVYNSLVENRSSSLACGSRSLDRSNSPSPDLTESSSHSNPLRMLRQGMTVRPKVRGNKHNVNGGVGSGGSTLDRNNCSRRSSRGSISALASSAFDFTTHQTLPRGFKTRKVPPPVKPKPLTSGVADDTLSLEDSSLDSEAGSNNPIPLPPRDRTKGTPTTNKIRHQRRYPLIIPGGVASTFLKGNGNTEPKAETSRLLIQHTHNPQLEASKAIPTSLTTSNSSVADCGTDFDPSASPSSSNKVPPAKPPRLFSSHDESFESQLAYEIESLDEMQSDAPGGITPVGVAPPAFPSIEEGGSLFPSSDHVSCEDLLVFAFDKPSCRKTQGPLHGTQSDEVHLLLKVLKNEVSAEECVETLNECNWDVHRALKLLRVRLLLPGSKHSITSTKSALESFSWDITKTASYLAATSLDDDDTTQV
ncbi:Tyrosine-protein kinase PR2 [Armadillidium nasatum]|uniref:non-specific protein-tyrosine kinase n=1 Tax=Armadillidium nasatum TaxID=96803 RepID=A0A5N5TIN8_9CRUS|nr:Tyrosine-protein kinase PR2 [Armadillidium nasatum]